MLHEKGTLQRENLESNVYNRMTASTLNLFRMFTFCPFIGLNIVIQISFDS